ncbi:hypothetical protein [Desulfovibrio ferrophilus]|uniref:Uncharacterized protein n=1 Tax=Desulfovibrio ferrophilus TaxID=241368 RepID=A0A2Z6AYQ0_9BACT|nr:hypothetical protein [Desulfovibrio ferrophilus]BBD08320.1 uncharacterized protein DFE_1594 [Desulfovibrio ferrophilus]
MSEESVKDINLLEMPLEGIAAYWLSLKKVMGIKYVPKVIQDEAENTEEPYIKYLLETCFTGASEADVRRLGMIRRESTLRELRLKLTLMREALVAIAAADNPRKALLRMGSYLPEPSLTEENLTKMALDMVRLAETGKDSYVVTVEASLPAEQLILKLFFYVLWARREGKAGLEPMAENGRCRYFNQGLGMVMDGFERGFVLGCLEIAAEEMLGAATVKMNLALDMALALRTKISYEDLFKVARAHML